MRTFALTEIDSDLPTVFLLNGGGQQPYTKFHKATRLFKQYNCNLVSLELPGHGKSYFEETVTAEEMIDGFTLELDTIISDYHEIGLFGYSLGGLLALKATERQVDKFMFTITTGAAMIIDKQQEKVMQEYTTVDFFERMRWLKIMKKYHKDGWKTLLESISPMLEVGSPLFVDPSKLSTTIPIHLILGDNDEVADYNKHESLPDPVNLHVLEDTSHFDYFTRSYDKMKDCMASILDNYLDAKN